MDTSKLKAIIIVILATFGALYLGIAAATAQLETVLWVVGAMTVVTCIALGRRIWLIIPFASSLGLVLPLPGNFSMEMIAQIITLGFSSLLFLMRRLPIRARHTELEVVCLLFVLCVVQVYLRNPVGLNLFGGDTVGGKPYILFIITTGSAYLLSVLIVSPTDMRWWIRLSVISSLLNFGIGAVGKIFPGVGYYLGATFSNDVEGEGTEVAAGEATRISFVRGISVTLATWIPSRISPLYACLRPGWLFLILCTLVAAAFSGYRSQLILVGLYFFVGICYRSGIKGALFSLILGSFGISLLALVNLVSPLPPNVQRALTFLPGTWDERFQRDAQGSTDWRVEMWKEALFTEKWIKNKWLGDGLGFTKAELDTMNKINKTNRGGIGVSGLSEGQETMMINGGYHSGPVQTIRVVGYVGLAVLLFGFWRVAVHAHRQIQRTRGTEWYPVALFLGLPFIVGPIFWVAIIGSFDGGGRMLMLGAALVSMMEKNLPLPAYVRNPRTPYILKSRSAPNAGTLSAR